jgi:histone H3/H4
MVGDAALHGYMHEAAVHMWRNAEVGTEYHESYHVFFRNLLTDAQRQALYREAENRYTITPEDIENARRGQPEMSDQEARLLALEEKMADEFREYVIHQQTPKTLTQKLKKWFKDLLAYIKALATNRVNIDQAFRMIESNQIPAKLSRNATLMKGKAFMLKKFSFDPVLGKELIEFAASRVYEEARNGNMNAKYLLGAPPKYIDGKLVEGSKSKIRNWFLRHAFHVKTQNKDASGRTITRALTNEEFGNMLDKYNSEGLAGLKEYAASKNISSGVPQTDSNGTVMPQQITDSKAIAQVFFSIYNDWYDKPSPYGTTEQRGFRHEVIKILPLYGFNVRDYISVETAKTQGEQQEESDIVEVAEEFKKIYSKSSMEENPASKLQQKALRALAGIEIQDTSSKTGLKRIANPMTVFSELSSAVHDARDFADMMSKLEKRKHNLDVLNSVYDYLLGVDTPTQALIFASVSMAANEFISVIKEVEVDEKGNRKTVIKGYNPEASGFDTYYKRVWGEAAMAANGIYEVEYSPDGDVLSLQLRDKNYPDLIEVLVGKVVSARKKNEGKLKNYSDEELIDIADLDI